MRKLFLTACLIASTVVTACASLDGAGTTSGITDADPVTACCLSGSAHGG